MDSNSTVRCPHLLSLGFHDNLVASTLNSHIGTKVEFQCTEPTPVLSGPESIKCTVYGKWNDSLPTCVASDIEETTSIFTDDVDVTTTSSASPDENEVESVIIILWIAGGVLLITLLILIGCILRTHKKQRGARQGSIRCPTQGQGQPRHGGVNPTFTSYDEIWTWIPVVTENSDNCRNQSRGTTSGRENSSRNSRLPSYNEAIHNAGSSRVSNPNPPRGPSTSQAAAGPSQSSTNQATLQIRPITTRPSHSGGAFSTSQDTRQFQSNVTSQVTMGTNHYDTIPADQRPSQAVNGNNVTYVSVTSSSGSALQQARDLVNRASAQAQRPLPSAPVLQTGSRPEIQYSQRQQQQLRLPDSVRQTAGQRSRPHTTIHQQPVYLPRYTQTSQDFNHSHNSAFIYLDGHVPSGRSQQTPRDEPPPPYSISRISEQTTSGSRSMTSSVPVYQRGLDSHYF